MNTNPAATARSNPQRRRWKWIALAAPAIVVLLLVWKLPGLKAQAEAGTAYGARVGCSCVYVQGRDIENCETDFEPGMEMVSLSDDPETQTVTASVPLLASASARYAGVSGCLMELPEE